jgi:hypothetical protein
MLARVGERSLASSCRGIPLRFTQRETFGAELVLDLNLLEPLARRVVVVVGRLASERQRPLPHAVREIGNLRRHASERRRIPFDADAEIAPKALQGTADGIGGNSAERLAHRLHGRPPLRLQDSDRRALDLPVRDVHSANTLRAQKADGAIFQVFCEGRGESFLPADPKTIRAFMEHEVKAGKKPATVRRYIATIGRAHIGAGLLNPCSSEAVRLGLKKMGRETSGRQTQARALDWKEIKEFIGSAGQGFRHSV